MRNYVKHGVLMKFGITTFAGLVVLSSAASAETNLPETGVCEYTLEIAGMEFKTSIQWSGEDALVSTRGQKFNGKVVGLRSHDDGFKFSILYEDSISGPAEMIIFEISSSDPARYRMANVGYDDLPNGQRVVGSVQGFEDLLCALVR